MRPCHSAYLLTAALAFPTVACAQPAELQIVQLAKEEMLSVGFDKGLLGDSGVMLLRSGRIVLLGRDREWPTAILSARDQDELFAYLRSAQFQLLLDELATPAYSGNRRNDGQEVYLSFGGKNLGYSVCAEGPKVSGEIAAFARRIDLLGKRYFPRLYKEELPVTTCAPASK